jgi:peptidyl-prolyl cis-trans isomerase C
MRALIEREVVTPEPDEDACWRFYCRNENRFRSSDLFEAAHILIAAPADDEAARRKAREAADTILNDLQNSPELFSDYARERSDCPMSAAEGGRLGQVTRGQTVAEFDTALARMRPGDLAVVETRYGFHVVRLDQRVSGRQLPYELVAERIAAYLQDAVNRRALAQYVAVLAGRSEICGVTSAGSTSPLVQ